MKFKKDQQLFFSNGLKAELGEFVLDKEESHHVVNVLRKEIGQELILTNGKGLKVKSIIIVKSKRETILDVQEILLDNPPESTLTIAIAPMKNIGRFEWFLEKATEIGVQKIIPIICQHSERKVIKKERLDKILIAAMKQSGRLWKPVLSEITSFDKAIAINDHDKFIAHCHLSSAKKELKRDEKNYNGILNPLIFIGPEGGFSENELNISQENKVEEISLGQYRLRSETAGIVACQLMASLKS